MIKLGASQNSYNHAFVLSLLRRFTRNGELLHPTITCFASNFISLQSMLQCQFELKKMFVCDECHMLVIEPNYLPDSEVCFNSAWTPFPNGGVCGGLPPHNCHRGLKGSAPEAKYWEKLPCKIL
jgi:hypothetical protein